MQKKTSKSKMVVYAMIGLLVLAIFVFAAIYLPGIMQTLHSGG